MPEFPTAVEVNYLKSLTAGDLGLNLGPGNIFFFLFLFQIIVFNWNLGSDPGPRQTFFSFK